MSSNVDDDDMNCSLGATATSGLEIGEASRLAGGLLSVDAKREVGIKTEGFGMCDQEWRKSIG